MPPRSLRLLIVAFWLATTAWWVFHELGLAGWFGEPPPYTIDLGEEIKMQSAGIEWGIWKDELPLEAPAPTDQRQKIGFVNTEIRYEVQANLYILHAEFTFNQPIGKVATTYVNLKSDYSITPTGQLRAIAADIDGTLTPVIGTSIPLRAHVGGPVEDGRFTPTLRLDKPIKETVTLEPVAVSTHGSILNPMHPINRIHGLRAGQRWRVPVIDPLADALTATARQRFGGLVPETPPRVFSAEVSKATLVHHGQNDVDRQITCFLIRYHDADGTACTWVRAADALVVQQEVYSAAQATRLVLRRREVPEPLLGSALPW